jgi:hypothetical protein
MVYGMDKTILLHSPKNKYHDKTSQENQTFRQTGI